MSWVHWLYISSSSTCIRREGGWASSPRAGHRLCRVWVQMLYLFMPWGLFTIFLYIRLPSCHSLLIHFIPSTCIIPFDYVMLDYLLNLVWSISHNLYYIGIVHDSCTSKPFLWTRAINIGGTILCPWKVNKQSVPRELGGGILLVYCTKRNCFYRSTIIGCL